MQSNLAKWLILNKIPHLGAASIKKLWDKFGSIEAIWEATEQDLQGVERLSAKAIESLLENKKLASVATNLSDDIDVFTLDDSDYPKNLKDIYDPPTILYTKGNLLLGDEKSIAIVGTRKASQYGLATAKKLSRELASLGVTIVSGLAAGIDTSAHEGALDVGGRTIAVLGCGVDLVYPRQNLGLKEAVTKNGAVVSEFPPGTKVEPWHFPLRNRIISGLSLGVIVVEGHYDSGAMITAKEALEQGREVFAVPGQTGFDQSKGPHWLIKQGAKLVESVEDVLEELKIHVQGPVSCVLSQKDYSSLSHDEQKVVAALSFEPRHIDALCFEIGCSISDVSTLLLVLEMKKLIKQLPGKMFVLA